MRCKKCGRTIKGSVRNLQRLLQDRYGIDLWLSSKADDLVVLSKIVVPEGKQGQGIGTRAMEDLTEWADREDVTVATTPSGDFGGNVGRLRSFYKSFGFVPNEGAEKDFRTSESMIRLPG